MFETKRLTILIHIYYDDTAFALYQKLIPLLDFFNHQVNIFINIPLDHPRLNQISKLARKKLPGCFLIKSTNVGKDIGGKLLLLHTYLKSGSKSDLLLFIHDKKSPQTALGDKWMDQLFAIIEKKNIEKILDIFNDDNSVGMIGNQELIFTTKNKSKKEMFAGNEQIIKEIASKYGLTTRDCAFVGGTMFWVRESIYRDFFEQNPPLEIRNTLENGNVLDDLGPTYTHSWERLLGWVISTKGYRIIGI